MNVDRPVFAGSAAVILVFLVLGAVFPEATGRVFAYLQDQIVTKFGWFYVLSVSSFLVFVVWLWLSRYGRIRLGKDDDEPEYSTPTWFAMLFSAGMGIGLMFFGVAEPVLHYVEPPAGEPRTPQAAQAAMNIAFFHWGLHAWAVYIVVGLALAYFAYRHDLPLTIRSALYPLLGERIHGPIGKAADIIAVFGTLFGVATSLGLGVMQINAGLEFLGVLELSTGNQLVLIAGITAVATVSVVTGLDAGIRRLSQINLILCLVLLLFVLAAGPTVFIASSFVQNIGQYLQNLPLLSFRTGAYTGTEWQKTWTMFYWGWWMSWSPFVGMFIARISRGRTIREFVAGVLFVPALLTFLWFTVFGGTALHFELSGNDAIGRAVSDNVPTALFVMLQQLPAAALSSALAVMVVALFFVTSSDSASLVIDILTTGGDPNPPVGSRIFWAVSEGAVAAVLLLAGGLVALQTAAIMTALPLSVLMWLMCWCVYRGVRAEFARRVPAVPGAAASGADGPAAEQGWRAQLKALMEAHPTPVRRPEPEGEPWRAIQAYIEGTVIPAFTELQQELARYGREAVVERQPTRAAISVRRNGVEEFYYAIYGRVLQPMRFALPRGARGANALKLHAEVVLREGVRGEYDISRFGREEIIRDFLEAYARKLRR